MGVSCGAIAISHLEHLDDEGIKAMAEKEVVGVILPTTHYVLKLKDPPVKKMLEAGVPVAIASDFCPNAHCMSLPLAMSLACLNLKMRVSEALCGVTLNAAAALNRSDMYGSLEVGKWGDMVVINESKWEHIIY
jgi:imidazolonepropionase